MLAPRLMMLVGTLATAAGLAWAAPPGGHGGGAGHGGVYHGGYYHGGPYRYGHGPYGPSYRHYYGPGFYRPYYGYGLGVGIGVGLGYGLYGPYAPYYGYGYAPPPVVVVSPPAYVAGSPPPAATAPAPQAGGPPPNAPPPDNCAHLQLTVPETADVWFQGTHTTQTGRVREFASAPLTPGQSYTYQIAVRYTGANGRPVNDTRDVHVRANDWFSIDFTQPAPSNAPAAPPNPLPPAVRP